MGLFDIKTATENLEDLLDRERVAVLNGRFDLLEQLSVEKEMLIRTVVRDGAVTEALGRLRVDTKRNSDLLEAMSAGIVAAQVKIKALKHPRSALQTYDAAGRKQAIHAHQKPSGHRA